MDFLQLGLIFLIALLTIFLTITGVQVFFILRDLKKTLDKLNVILNVDENKKKLDKFARSSVRFQNRRLFKRGR